MHESPPRVGIFFQRVAEQFSQYSEYLVIGPHLSANFFQVHLCLPERRLPDRTRISEMRRFEEQV